MEEASGVDLKDFFEQWLYKPGAMQCNGTWHYDDKKKEVRITIEQTQTDGSLFKMPVQVVIHPAKEKPFIKILEVNEKKNEFIIPLDAAPLNIVLDPDSWLLMDAKWAKK